MEISGHKNHSFLQNYIEFLIENSIEYKLGYGFEHVIKVKWFCLSVLQYYKLSNDDHLDYATFRRVISVHTRLIVEQSIKQSINYGKCSSRYAYKLWHKIKLYLMY